MKRCDEFCEKYSDAQLIIIGGHGNLHGKTLEWARKIRYWRNVTIVKSLDNPMPILKKCDLFVLSSTHEGLPVVLCEADCLNIPIISTDIPGPHSFMLKGGGYLMEYTKEGILLGMYDYVAGKVHPMGIDFDAWNKEALAAFNSLLLS